MSRPKRGHFVMKGYTAKSVNRYWCQECKDKKIPHKVVNIPGPGTTSRSCWGSGLPTTKRKCTSCGAEDGPWVSAQIAHT